MERAEIKTSEIKDPLTKLSDMQGLKIFYQKKIISGN